MWYVWKVSEIKMVLVRTYEEEDHLEELAGADGSNI
jgi:hypothetical protein